MAGHLRLTGTKESHQPSTIERQADRLQSVSWPAIAGDPFGRALPLAATADSLLLICLLILACRHRIRRLALMDGRNRLGTSYHRMHINYTHPRMGYLAHKMSYLALNCGASGKPRRALPWPAHFGNL